MLTNFLPLEVTLRSQNESKLFKLLREFVLNHLKPGKWDFLSPRKRKLDAFAGEG